MTLMKTPAGRMGWAGVLFLAGLTMARAEGVCDLSSENLCGQFEPTLQITCVKHVQLVAGACRKATRAQRWGSHEQHCRAACRADALAFELDRRLRDTAMKTAEMSGGSDAAWLDEARAFWQAKGADGQICSQAEFEAAKADCEKVCAVKAKRRDLDELQALAAGKEFLALERPAFGCPTGPATRALSAGDPSVLEKLYPPGHQRRSGAAAE